MGIIASGIAVVGAVAAGVWLVIGWQLGQARKRMEPTDNANSNVAIQVSK